MGLYSICVVTGTLDVQFDRLFAEIGNVERPRLWGFVQYGVSDVSPLDRVDWQGARVPYCSQVMLEEAVRGAQLVIIHAGIGAIMMAAKFGKPMLLVPRLQIHGEHFDDHQVQISGYLKRKQGIEVFEEGTSMQDALERLIANSADTRYLLNSGRIQNHIAMRCRAILYPGSSS